MTKLLFPDINDYITKARDRQEDKHNVEIPAADIEFLRSCMQEHTKTAIDKFIAGAIEHHDSPFVKSMSAEDSLKEALKEAIDLPFYLYNTLSKLRK